MTVQEMVSSGIEFQGDDIRLKVWSHSDDRYIFNQKLNETKADSPAVCELDVRYIYTVAGQLVIELESEE